MKKLVKKTALFILLFLCECLLFLAFDRFVIGNQFMGGYDAALIDKSERLKSITGNKIVLIGNSNLAFGMDSEMLEQKVGMPVVNMGLSGGLGNEFNESFINFGCSSGDIVIICHTNFADDDKIQSVEEAWSVLEWHEEFWKASVRKQDILPLIEAWPRYMHSAFLGWLGGGKGNDVEGMGGYARGWFNEYGDIGIFRKGRMVFQEGGVGVPEINDTCVDRINRLNSRLNEQGVTLLVAAYPIAYGEFTPDAEIYDQFECELRERLECEVISHYTDYFLPYEDFFDTAVHLTSEGAKKRTEILADDIIRWKTKEEGQ